MGTAGTDDEQGTRGTTGHPLAALAGLSAAQRSALHGRWVRTAEELLAMAASAPGREGLKQLLEISDTELDALLTQAVALVGPEAAERLSHPAPGGKLGVALTPEQKQKRGTP